MVARRIEHQMIPLDEDQHWSLTYNAEHKRHVKSGK